MISVRMFLSIFLTFLPIQSGNNLTSEQDKIRPSIAQLIIDRGLAKINNDTRKNVIADLNSIDDKYTSKQTLIEGKYKSRQERKKTITGRPSLAGMSVDKLYDVFKTRFDFIIENDDSTGVINGTQYALIKFTPKPNLTSNTVTDSFINHTAGKIYINLDNYEITKIEGGVNNHFVTTWKAWWSLISFDIDVYEFSFSIDYVVFNNMTIEKNLNCMVDYEIRNRGINKYIYTLSNYRIK